MARTQTAKTPPPDSLIITIVEKIADREGVEPIDLPPLYDFIDPDALTALFAATEQGDSRNGGRVEFTYCQYTVVVYGNDQVDIENDEEERTETKDQNK